MRRFSTTANESHSDRQFQQSDETQLNNPIFIGDNGIALETIVLTHLMTQVWLLNPGTVPPYDFNQPPKIDGGLPQLYYSIYKWV